MTSEHCAGCGYLRAYHEALTLRCPDDKADGGFLKTKKFQERGPLDRTGWREIMRRDYLARKQVYDDEHAPYEPTIVPPPLIPARSPRGASELAGYQGRQAIGLGRLAIEAGYVVSAHYWLAGDQHEGCALKFAKGTMRAVATWSRKPGNIGKTSGWSAGIAYGWPEGRMPIKLTHTELENAFRGDAS